MSPCENAWSVQAEIRIITSSPPRACLLKGRLNEWFRSAPKGVVRALQRRRKAGAPLRPLNRAQVFLNLNGASAHSPYRKDTTMARNPLTPYRSGLGMLGGGDP